MKRKSRDPWNLKIDETYEPSISVLVPAHNEAVTIGLKLKNLLKLNYPSEKMEIILVNDASSDATLEKMNEFVRSNNKLKTKVLSKTERSGKSGALNFALKNASNEIIVVSDADCFLSTDALSKSLPFLSDQNVGAVAGREMLLNPESSWVTKSELFFNNFVQPQRIGESKLHSALSFQGGLAAYKKECLGEFDRENDDSGTALNIVQGNRRAIILPEARFYTLFPVGWKNKVALKIRRSGQLQRMWIKCLKFLAKGRLLLPKRIAIPEIFLHVFNPLVFLALIFMTVFLGFQQIFFAIAISSALLVALAIPRSRMMLVESIQNYLILLTALLFVTFRQKFRVWKNAPDSRDTLDEAVLLQHHLV